MLSQSPHTDLHIQPHTCRPGTHFQYTLSTKTKRFFIRYVLMRFFLDVVVCQLQMFCYFFYACWQCVCVYMLSSTNKTGLSLVAALACCRGKLFFFIRTMEKVYTVSVLCFVVFDFFSSMYLVRLVLFHSTTHQHQRV